VKTDGIPQVLEHGIEAASRGAYAVALPLLSAVYQNVPLEQHPRGLSSYGLCLSRVEHKNKLGAELCEKAIALDPGIGLHWANLVRLYIGVKNRRKAVEVLERGLGKLRNDPTLMQVREEIGYRKAPSLRFLRRTNPINKLFSRTAGNARRNPTPIIIAVAGLMIVAIFAASYLMIMK